MKVKVTSQMKDPAGNDLPGDKGKTLTMRDVCINSLLTPVQGDDEKVKWEKYEVYKALRDAKEEVELKVEQVSLLKKAVGKIQSPLLMGQIWEMLEK